MKLAGQKALVTGSSQGIGQGIALRYVEEGADVIITYHGHPESADETVEQIRKMGRKAVALGVDLTSVPEVQDLVTKSFEHLGGLSLLVNNAGVEKKAPFWEVTEKDYDLVLNTNLKAAFFATQVYAQKLMEAKQPGKVINVSSVHEELPFPHFTSYCASKGGMKMMMRNLAIELAPYNITVNNIAPGAIETPINAKLLNDPKALEGLMSNIPLRRLGKPADVAGAAVFLASADADYVTGATIFVDGGLTWNYSEQ